MIDEMNDEGNNNNKQDVEMKSSSYATRHLKTVNWLKDGNTVWLSYLAAIFGSLRCASALLY